MLGISRKRAVPVFEGWPFQIRDTEYLQVISLEVILTKLRTGVTHWEGIGTRDNGHHAHDQERDHAISRGGGL